MNKHPIIRKIYLYLFALIGLSLVSIGGVRLVGLGLKTYVFTKADVYYEYPAPRPLKIASVIEGGAVEESQRPTQGELEEYQAKQQSTNRQREAAEALAFIIVGAPLYLYHWSVIKKDKEEELANGK